MKVSDIKKKEEEISSKLRAEFAQSIEAWKDKNPQLCNDSFIRNTYISSDQIDTGFDAESLMQYAQDFLLEIDDLPYHIKGRCFMDIEAYDEEVVDNCLKYVYRIHITNKAFEDQYKNSVFSHLRSYISNELFKEMGEAATYEKTIDCKLLKLFKNEDIEWNTLKKMVYSDCTIQ